MDINMKFKLILESGLVENKEYSTKERHQIVKDYFDDAIEILSDYRDYVKTSL